MKQTGSAISGLRVEPRFAGVAASNISPLWNLLPSLPPKCSHDLLASFPRSQLVRRVTGPVDRPPVAVLHYFRIRVDDTIDDYMGTVRRQPVFGLKKTDGNKT
jgi:hypothetical protein